MARQMRLQQLKDITGNFSKEQELGRGGFGVVYKGILKNRVSVAVKRLEVNPGIQDKQFKNEINLVVLNGVTVMQLSKEYARVRNKWSRMSKIMLQSSSLDADGCQQVDRCFKIGLNCVDLDPRRRPLATQIINMLPWECKKNEGMPSELVPKSSDGSCTSSAVRNKWSRMSKIMLQSSSLDADGCQQVDRCFKIGLNCVDLDPRRRPLASQIINMLPWECKKNEGIPSELVPKSSDGSCTSSATVDGMCISVKIPSIAKTIELSTVDGMCISVKIPSIAKTIELSIELKEGIHLDNQILMVDVRNWYTVADVKLMVETMFGFPECSQILLPTKSGDAIELNGTQTLKDQNIKNNAVLMLLPDFRIFIKTWEGRTLTMVVSSFHTEEDIWEKIQKKSMINPKNTFSVTMGMF
uniref:Ubiquitin-like domain-containing protein n=1 Tax=Oryza rufipogon TaxID=4529 RepID=A0A0E0R736_ORYRU